MSQELTLYFPQSGETISLKETETIVGGRKKGDCNLHLTNKYFTQGEIRLLSRKHFTIYKKDGHFVIKDLGSTRGTEVDGKKLSRGREVLLRLDSVIRLAQDDNFLIEVIDDSTIAFGHIAPKHQTQKSEPGLVFEKENKIFIVDGQPIHALSDLLESLLMYLYKNAGRTCSYSEINKHVWYNTAKKNTINATVGNLRKKLEEVSLGAGGERYIKTIRGYGYKLIRK